MHSLFVCLYYHKTHKFQGHEKSVYELVVRHFLACISKDAEGRETTIEIEVNAERVSCS